MNRIALALLTCPIILASMLLLANTAQAAEASNMMLSAPTAQVIVVQYQQVPASVQPSNPIKDHLGCSCAACTKALSQMQGQFTL
ncbi:hypothetical protein NDI44_09355 [Trichocoleus sp. DQ-A3]|uniref:hypothetical protein n=1 Tax=Cyanophyceae TaxID=3028117 RepID=UPI001686C1A8|nr:MULTISPECIES: hypothetical protein [unclassified Coleofasciculus]MBD1837734.1 hypothetical protein [Coleofasciculus sp. FACHB-501]MBD1888634.1 hypothetical protein [Coleofasciculus sp. FACHB-SPT9]MBD1902961.1 hypothetical protein [Coleofasciculus sp. FACHB-125]MBD2085389.1 hypothetical protein [Coleofasciculus sp. FACHB-542]